MEWEVLYSPALPRPFIGLFLSTVSFGPAVLQPALKEAAGEAVGSREVAPHAPMRSSAQKSSRCVLPSSVSSPTWIRGHCYMLQRSAGTGALWPAIPLSGRECCSRMPESVLRCLPLPSLEPNFAQQNWPKTSNPHSPGSPRYSRGASSGLTHHQPVKFRPLFLSLDLSQFLAMLAQWCTQAHSLTLQNLKPRQRGKKESKEEYARSTR